MTLNRSERERVSWLLGNVAALHCRDLDDTPAEDLRAMIRQVLTPFPNASEARDLCNRIGNAQAQE